jgi:dTDP-4-dehydrorhamnose 3,5-epimerase
MQVIQTRLPGVLIFEPKVFGDSRGFFVETFRDNLREELGIPLFVQDNQSRSRRGVLRGLHYQLVQPQGKLVRVASGRVFDVAVDVRRGSPTFGQWAGVVLDDVSHRQFYVPPNFAHGFVVLSEMADFVYKCTDYYHPASESGIAWNDPDVGIEWPAEILDAVALSGKDAVLPQLKDQQSDKLPAFGVQP